MNFSSSFAGRQKCYRERVTEIHVLSINITTSSILSPPSPWLSRFLSAPVPLISSLDVHPSEHFEVVTMSLSDSECSSHGAEYKSFGQISRERELLFLVLVHILSISICKRSSHWTMPLSRYGCVWTLSEWNEPINGLNSIWCWLRILTIRALS